MTVVEKTHTAKMVSLARAMADTPSTTEMTWGVMTEYKEGLRDVYPIASALGNSLDPV